MPAGKDKLMQEELTKLSDPIGALCSLLDHAPAKFDYHYQKVGEMDKLTQDYLHMVELQELYDMELVKFAEELRDCRRERRAYKDICDRLQPLIDFLNTDKGKAAHNQLKQLLGQVRDAEKRQENRQYIPRILKEEEWK